MTPDEEKWTLDVARATLQDLGELEHARYRIKYFDHPTSVTHRGIPYLLVMFDHPQAVVVPALAILLSNPATGNRFRDDTLRRAIRNGMEKYLRECGVPVVAKADWRGWVRNPT